MNDRRFIELLNLYVDQELSDQEARELEREIADRPDRRRVYSQYCRMQRACVKLLEQQEAPAPRLARITRESAATTAAEPAAVLHLPELIRQRSRRRRTAWAGWSGGLMAAAACLALAFVSIRQPMGTGEAPPAEVPTDNLVAAISEDVPPAAIASTERSGLVADPAPAYRPVLSVNVLLRPNGAHFAQASTGLAMEEPGLDWLQQLKLTPIRQIPYEPLPFQSTGGLRAADANHGNRMDEPVPAHMITFEFRR